MKFKIQIEGACAKIENENGSTIQGLEMMDDIYWRVNRQIEGICEKAGKAEIKIDIEIKD